MQDLRYDFEKGRVKHTCPSCQTPKKYKRYIDTLTGELLPEKYGYCDRRIKCGYDLNPYKDGYKSESTLKSWQQIERKIPKPPPPPIRKVYVPDEILIHLERNNKAYNSFLTGIKNCVPDLPDALISQVAALYRIGTVKAGYLQNGCAFPFIDSRQRVQFIQIKTFSDRAKTIKTGTVSTLLNGVEKYREWCKEYDSQDLKVGCFFGAHLLRQFPNNPIALVESPKNAIIGTLFFGLPDENPNNYLWLAAYSISTLKLNRAKELQGRNVILFPDRGALTKWQEDTEKLQKLMPDTTFEVSGLMESETAQNICPDSGADIADLLLTYSWCEFTGHEKHEKHESENEHFLSAPTAPPPPEPPPNKHQFHEKHEKHESKNKHFLSVHNPLPDSESELIARCESGETLVINIKTHRKAFQWAANNGYYVQIDRKTKFGNPYKLKSESERDKVCEQYFEYLKNSPDLHNEVLQLKGKVLGCHCAPKRCHGNEIIRFINEYEQQHKPPLQQLVNAFGFEFVTENTPEPPPPVPKFLADEMDIVVDMVRKWNGRMPKHQALIELPVRLISEKLATKSDAKYKAEKALEQAVNEGHIFYSVGMYRLQPTYAYQLV